MPRRLSAWAIPEFSEGDCAVVLSPKVPAFISPESGPGCGKNAVPRKEGIERFHRTRCYQSDMLREREIVQFVRTQAVDLVGMGFMSRMAQKAYRLGRAIRTETKVPVVFGGPHVTAVPEEALGRTDEPQAADSVVLGEADRLWPLVVEDVAQGRLQTSCLPNGALRR